MDPPRGQCWVHPCQLCLQGGCISHVLEGGGGVPGLGWAVRGGVPIQLMRPVLNARVWDPPPCSLSPAEPPPPFPRPLVVICSSKC